MNWGQLAGAILSVIVMIMKSVFSGDAERKKVLKEAQDEIKDGIKKRDKSKVNAAIAKAKRA